MMHTMRDIEELSLTEPALYALFTLAQRDDWTPKQFLTESLYWYVHALQASRAQLLEAINVRPSPWVLTSRESSSEGEDGSLG